MFKRSVWVVSLLLVWVALVQAHEPGLSTATLRLSEKRLTAVLTFALSDVEALLPLDLNRDGQITPGEFEDARPGLEKVTHESLEVEIDGRPVPAAQARVERVETADQDNLEVRLDFALAGAGSHLRVRSPLIGYLPRGHRQYLSLLNENDQVLEERLLGAGTDFFDHTLANQSRTREGLASFRQFLVLGVEHIVTGYDHLLFLLGLLVVGGGFRAAAKIITSFTVAHSITLVLATLEVVALPARLVEPLIAFSIIWVGLENLLRRNLERRWLLVFGFGLVHGLGFASVLQELNVAAHGTGVALPLLAFNVGVELGQIGLAAVVLPLIWKLCGRPLFIARVAFVSSVTVVLAGAYWLGERLLLSGAVH